MFNSVKDAMTGIRISIDWEALETAAERNTFDSESFLEISSGQVVVVMVGDPEAVRTKAKLAENIDNYIRVEPASSREQYRWMENFVTSVSDEPLRRRLVMSIDGKGAFRRFKNVLLAYPEERERWFGYRSSLLRWHLQTWLKNNNIVAADLPPWGVVLEPEKLEVVEPLESTRECTSGGSMRRHAKELIDGIAPLDLSSAVAFLEFLQAQDSRVVQLVPAVSSETVAVENVASGPKIVQ